jgi:hypothetical protein
VADIKFINGLWQTRCNSLAPKGFDWIDKGINPADVDMIDSVTGTMLADQETIRPGMYLDLACILPLMNQELMIQVKS